MEKFVVTEDVALNFLWKTEPHLNVMEMAPTSAVPLLDIVGLQIIAVLISDQRKLLLQSQTMEKCAQIADVAQNFHFRMELLQNVIQTV